MTYPVDEKTYRSPAQNRRVRFLILHYTAIDFQGSLNAFTGAKAQVSAHYLIPDPTDPTYIKLGFKELRIFRLVDELERSWHAGTSSWGSRNNLNDTAIGIEIVNLATDQQGIFTFPPYHPQQIEAVHQICTDILKRFPDIHPTNVLAHSDISIGRKSDPGASFPWKALHKGGIGAWFDEQTKAKFLEFFEKTGLPRREDVNTQLKRYGYDTSNAQSDKGFSDLVRAFQLHFRQENYDGKLDIDTAATIWALVEKYFPST